MIKGSLCVHIMNVERFHSNGKMELFPFKWIYMYNVLQVTILMEKFQYYMKLQVSIPINMFSSGNVSLK